MTIEEIRNLANAPKYTQEIKDTITKEADKYGIVIPDCKCRNKWHDVIMQIYAIMKKTLQNPVVRQVITEVVKSIFKYKLLKPTRFGGKIYSANTPIDDILSLKKHNKNVFDALYVEVKQPDNEKSVEFYKENQEDNIAMNSKVENMSNGLEEEIKDNMTEEVSDENI